jgi:hypothetical protein
MPDVNEQWIREQFQEAKVKVATGKAVLKLLEAWSKLDLTEKQAAEAVEIFSKVALVISIVPDKPDEVWAPAQPGFIAMGEEVRVKSDAFSGELAATHNGRRGKVVGVRYGDVIVRSTDNKSPFLDGAHYSPYMLEKRVR